MERTLKAERGFTIVEVLIVLAVTSAMFLLAALAINGKQNTTEFQQSINDIQSEIQQAIDQVAAGDYPDTGNFTCSGTSSLNIQKGVGQQGSNDGCIYLGKVLQFGVKDTDPQQYISYTIAGLQNNNGSLTTATPTAIAPGVVTNASSNFPNASVADTLHDGLTVVKMTNGSITSGTQIGAVAFISSLGQYNNGSLVSGSQQISLVPVNGSSLNATSPSTVDAINKKLVTSPQNPSNGVQICFASAGTNQSGLITIGSGARALSVTLQVKNGRSC